MLSIVVCHRNKTYLEQLTKNISDTVGIEYELIVIDNSTGQYSIFEAYHLGVEKSKYQIICFTHEDIIFHDQNWGKVVMNHFKDESIGMIGVIGGNVFPKSPSPWWSNQLMNDHLVNNIQHWYSEVSKEPYHTIISSTTEKTITRDYNNPTKLNVVDAVVLDGLWFCIRKTLFNTNKIKFDTETFKGFHCYDSDISLQVKKHQRVCVVYDILVEHLQQGTINKEWFENVILLNKKWRSQLPIFAKEINREKYILYEWETLRTFIYWIQSRDFSEHYVNQLILDISAKLPVNKEAKPIRNELVNRAKYGRFIARIMNKLNF